MKIVVAFLKVGCSISGIAAALWIFRFFGRKQHDYPGYSTYLSLGLGSNCLY